MFYIIDRPLKKLQVPPGQRKCLHCEGEGQEKDANLLAHGPLDEREQTNSLTSVNKTPHAAVKTNLHSLDSQYPARRTNPPS